jgi:hypothetical protein
MDIPQNYLVLQTVETQEHYKFEDARK